ncbi:MAG: polyprenyl synthetase family protein [Phycisphaerales bacterium]
MSRPGTAPETSGEAGALTREPAGAVDVFLAEYLDAAGLAPGLDDAVRYALLGGGKRIRPTLAWWCAVACGAPGETTLPAGGAIELVHAFSLVHDDLPAMDDDDLRRGRPTLHVHAGEAMAILAGDAMLTLAFGALRRPAPGAEALPGDVVSRLVEELVRGTTGMIDGQVYDTLGGLDASLDDAARLEAIHSRKTGALIRAACRMGTILGAHHAGMDRGAADEALARLTRYGEAVGLMFQIVDDLLDVEATHEQTGKRTGKDANKGKLTYPGVFGIERARAEVARLGQEAGEAVRPFGERGRQLRELGEALAVRAS